MDGKNIKIIEYEQKSSKGVTAYYSGIRRRKGKGKYMDVNKITLSGYIAYLKNMYKRYGNISIAQLKHIERIRK